MERGAISGRSSEALSRSQTELDDAHHKIITQAKISKDTGIKLDAKPFCII